MVMVCLLAIVDHEGEDGSGGGADEGRAAAGAAEDRPGLELSEAAFDEGAGGVYDPVVGALALGQVVPLALDWDGHPRSSAGVGLVGEDLQAGGGRPGEDLVAAGGSEIVGRAGVAGSDPQQLSIA